MERRLEMFENHLTQHQLRRAYLEKQMKKIRRRTGAHIALSSAYLVLTGAIMRQAMTCEWLEKCIRLTEQTE